ncbi:hypothetical protein B0A52_07196 [Exophiala mesophila]|uniref:endo-1,3(4)-beta-glucanase n=1 Tax=Exophiala mesophila TaxID=212818 RepID=A0A438N0I9_EXOME|nr:hypothetical protein B0A52_07196 [Exophiala mesophila]
MSSAILFVAALAALVPLTTAGSGYVLEDDYTVDKFFSMFEFFTAPDPTHGYVTYIGQSAAQAAGLVNTNNGAVYMGVDYTNVASGSGRQSVRITSKKSYTHGLIILDSSHMPGGICGTWPAFWTVGPNWPTGGEIDIIEGVNSQTANSMALHTGPGCSIQNSGLFEGQISTPNCDVAANGQATNAGCQIHSGNKASYGAGFNANQGGVFATEWTSSHISIWFFPRGGIPSDISAGNPDPSGWGQPAGSFTGGCEIDNFFSNNQIVFDTTFCGDWAGNVWSSDPVCSSKASTCQQYVRDNPAAFKDAFWSINSLRVYQSGSGGSNPQPGGPTFGPGEHSVVPTVSGGGYPTAGQPQPSYGGEPGGQPQPSSVGNDNGNNWGNGNGWDGGNGGGRRTKSWGAKANFAAVDTGVPTVTAVNSNAAGFYAAPVGTDSVAFDPAPTDSAVPVNEAPSNTIIPIPDASGTEAPTDAIIPIPEASDNAVSSVQPAPATTPCPTPGPLQGGNFEPGMGESNGIYFTITSLPNGYFETDDDVAKRKREASPVDPAYDHDAIKHAVRAEKRGVDQAGRFAGHRLLHRHVGKRELAGNGAEAGS